MAVSTQPYSVEHSVPQVRGGEDALDNLSLACQGCNGHKYTKTHAEDPITRQIVPLFHPRQQDWQEHFIWSHDYFLILGRTPIGRATVKALQLNRKGVVNLRQLLLGAGLHPPS
jgi:5-methylcytosine-specific restriction endonuclease McrA